MRIFDYTFLKEPVPANVVKLLSSVQASNRALEIETGTFPQGFQKLEESAMAMSVKASNEIEGIVTTRERMEGILSGEVTPHTRDEEEISGYRDALDAVHANWQGMGVNQKTILSLHKMIMSPTGENSAGRYKDEDNLILEVLSDGTRMKRFIPITAEDTPEAMEQLVLAYLDAKADAEIDNLLLAACVILDFLCIHPFMDGNGRVSRLLSLVLLYKEGFTFQKYVSFENMVNQHRERYYRALKRSSAGWMERSNDYYPFVADFLLVMYECQQDLREMSSRIQRKMLSEEAEVRSHVCGDKASVREIAEKLPQLNPVAVETALVQMFTDGELKMLRK